jgi:hypothetical protein
MDATRVHLFLNYFPITGELLGIVLLLLGLWKGSERAKRFGLYAFCLTALLTFGVFGSGEAAGSGAGLLVGPVWTNIVDHKSSAMPTFAAIEASGVIAVIGLFKLRKGSELPIWLLLALLFLSFAAVGLAARTTYLGRNIHTVSAAAAK